MRTTTDRIGIPLLVLALLFVGIAGASSGCEKSEDWRSPGPDGVFAEFLTRWFENDRQRAFEMVDPEDRGKLEKPLEKVEERLGSQGDLKGSEMLVAGRVDNPYDVKSIEVDPQLEEKPDAGTRVRLRLTYQDEETGEASMVWRDGKWYVDLPLEESAMEGAKGAAFGRPEAATESDEPSDIDDAEPGVK